jgi:hypothetical protein
MARVQPIDAQDLARRTITLNVDVRVVNLRRVKARLWLAVQVCRLAAWVGGIGLQVNQSVGVIVTKGEAESPNEKEIARP